MSLALCIPGLIADGTITPERGRRMEQKYKELLSYYRGQMGEAAAAAAATEKTLEQLTAEAALRKRREILSISAQRKLSADMAGFDGGNGGGVIDPRAAIAVFAHDSRSRGSNVDGRRRAIRARSHAMLDGVLAAHHTNAIGQVRMKAQLTDIVRELFGEDSGSASAREMADAWSKTADMLRQRFNAAGGDIAKLERWGLPQAHDTRAIRQVDYHTWRDAIAPALDRTRMIDQRTGLPFTDDGFEQALGQVYETLRTDGWNGRNPGGQGRGSLASRYGDHRFLIFKSAGDWLDYQARFGVGTPFDAMMGHIDGMARDIALMEVLGPNPNATVKWLKDSIEKSAQLDTAADSKAVDRAFAGAKQVDRLYEEITGSAGRPENRTIALAFSTIRSLQTAAKLGGAVLSAIPTDPAFGVVTRKFNGLPAAGIIRDYIKYFQPFAHADRQQALRLTGIAEEWSKRAGGQQRALGEELTSEVAKRLAEGALRVTGLNRFTEAGRWATGMTFVSHITGERGKDFAALDGPFRRALQRYGIDAAGWDSIRATPLERDGGADWLKPSNVADRRLGDRLYEMIQSEVDYAVPTPDLRTRALVNSVAPKGTWLGESVRTAALFKGFGISMILMQTRRIMEAASTGKWNAARYAAGLFIATTIGGALAMQLKALAAGKDPLAMDDVPGVQTDENGNRGVHGGFWGAAILQGGGFGIFGDFLQSAQNRFGGGLPATLAGPVVQDVQGMMDVATSKKPGWAATRLLRQQLPGGSTFYARLAFDRLVTDQIQEQIDPNYRQAWDRMAKRARDQRTQYWWQPGDTAPARAPDMSNALGNASEGSVQ